MWAGFVCVHFSQINFLLQRVLLAFDIMKGSENVAEMLNENAISQMLTTLISGKKYASVRDVFETMHAADIAAVLEDCEKEVVPLLFRLLPKELKQQGMMLKS